jgi:hypothetical protein
MEFRPHMPRLAVSASDQASSAPMKVRSIADAIAEAHVLEQARKISYSDELDTATAIDDVFHRTALAGKRLLEEARAVEPSIELLRQSSLCSSSDSWAIVDIFHRTIEASVGCTGELASCLAADDLRRDSFSTVQNSLAADNLRRAEYVQQARIDRAQQETPTLGRGSSDLESMQASPDDKAGADDAEDLVTGLSRASAGPPKLHTRLNHSGHNASNPACPQESHSAVRAYIGKGKLAPPLCITGQPLEEDTVVTELPSPRQDDHEKLRDQVACIDRRSYDGSHQLVSDREVAVVVLESERHRRRSLGHGSDATLDLSCTNLSLSRLNIAISNGRDSKRTSEIEQLQLDSNGRGSSASSSLALVRLCTEKEVELVVMVPNHSTMGDLAAEFGRGAGPWHVHLSGIQHDRRVLMGQQMTVGDVVAAFRGPNKVPSFIIRQRQDTSRCCSLHVLACFSMFICCRVFPKLPAEDSGFHSKPAEECASLDGQRLLDENTDAMNAKPHA